MAIIDRRSGATVRYGGAEMKVVAVNDFTDLTLKGESGEYVKASIADLEAELREKPRPKVVVDLKRQEKVPAYLRAFGPLLEREATTKAEVRKAGLELGISVATAYACLARYRLSGLAADLPPPTRPGGRGKSRLVARAETIIQDTIDEILLNRRNQGPRAFYRAVNSKLQKQGLAVSTSTLRNRIAAISDHRWTKARKGYSEARRTHDPLRGTHPEVMAPLDLIQIDHWKMDIEILSDDRLKPIGRVWLTLGIDVYSRMVWGFHIGLAAPGVTPMAMAMINGMTPKDQLLERYKLPMKFPICGKPKELKADNAQEFTGNSILQSCEHFGINLTWRPLGAPQYGGHIERLNGTLAQRFKELPGATGSNISERKAFRPELTAAFTLEDLTKHTLLIFDEYHNQVHSGIGMTPLEKFHDYYFGPNGLKRSLPRVYVDDNELRVPWYPLERRSAQRYGIRLDYLDYYNESLEQIIRNKKDFGKLQIRRNPFDVREIYVLHPVRKEWLAVGTRHINFPTCSISELRDAQREATRRKNKPTPEVVAQIIDEQQRHIEETKSLTKRAARSATRAAHNNRLREQAPATPFDLPKQDRVPQSVAATSVERALVTKAGPASSSGKDRTWPDPEMARILASLSDADIEENLNDR